MKALQLRKLSPLARRERISHARALASPMPRVPMCGDPYMMAIATLQGARAMLERRACQYAAWLAAKQYPTLDLRALNARFDGAGRVWFMNPTSALGDFSIDLPAHVLAFDADAPAIALPAPDAADPATPRCDHTAPLELAPPAADRAPAAPAAPAAKIDRPAPLRLAPTRDAWRASQAREKAAREFEESRAARAARIAALPASARRQIGAR